MARTAKTLTAQGNAQIDTAQSKFGGASGLFDGAGDYLSIPDSNDFDMGTGIFTIDFWCRPFVQTNSYPSMIACQQGWSAGTFYIRYDNTGADTKFGVYWNGEGDPVIISANTYAVENWYHIAVVRDGTSLKQYINGTLDGSATISAASAVDLSLGGSVRIGGGNVSLSTDFYGWIDEFRISKGIARWTANFTPPSSAYDCSVNNDSYTVLMAHMDGADASTTFTDDNSECSFIPQIIII